MTSTKQLPVIVATLAIFALCTVLLSVSSAFAETNGHATTTPSHPPIMMHHATTTSVNIACVQSALDTRETAIGSAFDTMQSAVKSALATRKTSLHDAWGLTDRTTRRAAIKSSWIKWSMDSKVAQTTLRESRKATWATFKNTVKNTCKVSLPPEEGLGNDSMGHMAL